VVALRPGVTSWTLLRIWVRSAHAGYLTQNGAAIALS
jgi:hypothetical protein